MNPRDFDLSGAASVFAIANAPLFLVRKLQVLPAVQQIAKALSSEEILADLEKAVQEEPRALVNAVRPYVYLVALSIQRNHRILERAAALKAQQYDWFEYIARALLEMYKPTLILPPGSPNYSSGRPTISTRTEAPVHRFIITPGS